MSTMGTLIIALAAAALLVVLWRGAYWYKQGRLLQKDGYLPPHPTFVGQFALRLICRMASWLFIGPVKVIGRRNAKFAGRLNILPNHQFPLDFTVAGTALPYGFRHLGTAAEMNHPVKGALAAFAGFFAVKTEKGHARSGGQAAVEACGQALALHRRSRLLMFPQGSLIEDNVLRPEEFRTGAIRAMHAARDHFDAPVETLAVLPVAIHYLRDPRHATWFHRLVVKLGWKNFRRFRYSGKVTANYGAVVAIGEPIPLASLPDEPRAAIEAVRVVMDNLLKSAEDASN